MNYQSGLVDTKKTTTALFNSFAVTFMTLDKNDSLNPLTSGFNSVNMSINQITACYSLKLQVQNYIHGFFIQTENELFDII